MSIGELATNLEEVDPGRWMARSATEVSYPEDGHASNFEVEDTSFWFQHRNRVITALVEKYSPEKLLFDIGGGNGCVSDALQRSGHPTVLVEPGPEGIRNARKRGISTLVQATLEDAGFRPNSMAAAGAFDVVEHIEDDAGFVRSIGELLEPGGHFFVTVPAFQSLWSSVDVAAGHYRRYTRAELRNLFESAGLVPVFDSYIFWPLPPLVLLTRSIPSRLNLRTSREADTVAREHGAGGSSGASLMKRLLDPEAKRVAQGKTMPVGNSIIAVARAR